MKTVLIKAIKYLVLYQLVLLFTLLISFELFINTQVAFFSAVLIMLGSMYSYYRLVNKRLENYENMDESDLVDKIDDPYDLYGENVQGSENEEEVDIKAVIKEEKQRLKANTAKNTISSAPAMASLYRLVPYVFLVVGFIGLKNNGLLSLWPYLTGLGFGVLGGLFFGRVLFKSA